MKYGNELLIFGKKEVAKTVESGANSGDLRSTLFAVNKIFDLAEERDIKYFYIMCDDYYEFDYMFDDNKKGAKLAKNLDLIFDMVVDFFKTIPVRSIAFAQTGDFIGGINNGRGSYRFSKRKVMNSSLCSTERKFTFFGRINEDVNTYTKLGSVGSLFITVPFVSLTQKSTQSNWGGMTDIYLDNGTYIKSFYSIIFMPSSIKIRLMGDNPSTR